MGQRKSLTEAVSVSKFQILSERIHEFKLVLLDSGNKLFAADIFSTKNLQFDYSSKIFSTTAKNSLALELRPLRMPHPKFKSKDNKEPRVVDLSVSKTFFDRLFVVYEEGLGVFDLEAVLPPRKSLASELMILNWPNKLIDSISRLKKEKQSAFYSEKMRQTVKSLIREKVDQRRFENPKFTTLFVINGQIVTNQIELLKESKQLSFGQVPKYSTLVRMLATDEFQGAPNARLLAQNVEVLRLSGDPLPSHRQRGAVFPQGADRAGQRPRQPDDERHLRALLQRRVRRVLPLQPE